MASSSDHRAVENILVGTMPEGTAARIIRDGRETHKKKTQRTAEERSKKARARFEMMMGGIEQEHEQKRSARDAAQKDRAKFEAKDKKAKAKARAKRVASIKVDSPRSRFAQNKQTTAERSSRDKTKKGKHTPTKASETREGEDSTTPLKPRKYSDVQQKLIDGLTAKLSASKNSQERRDLRKQIEEIKQRAEYENMRSGKGKLHNTR